MSRAFLISLAAGIAGALVAHHKGRNYVVWFALCLVFPLALLILFFLPRRFRRGLNKACPYCGGIVGRDALRCGRCGRELPIDMVECPGCGRFVQSGDYCPECNRSLRM